MSRKKMPSTTNSDAGFMSLDALGGMMILFILIPIAAMLWNYGVQGMKKRAVAEHFMAVETAAKLYGKRLHTTLLSQSTATTGPNITLAQMKTANCLPTRFSEVNAWGQRYQITTRRDSTGVLSVVVLTTGGRGHSANTPEFANIHVPEAAAMARAGFIPTGLVGNASVLRGAYGAWEVTLASLGLTATAGHLGTISTFSASDLAQDFLYRVAVPGEPELNAMQTALDMTNHAIRGVSDVSFVSKAFAGTNFCTRPEDEGKTFLDTAQGLYLCRGGKVSLVNDSSNSMAFKDARLSYHNQRITKPTCAPGTNTHPEVFVAPSIMSVGAETPAIASVQAWATDASATEWLLQMRILTAENEWVYPTANYGRMIVMTSCAPN